jgi:DNA-directed RNA polymerase specialized sigma24 family protein
MSKSHAVAQHVPYLRRYARALTGSQISGDTYVAATLEALVREPELLEFGGVTPNCPVSAVFNDLEFAGR